MTLSPSSTGNLIFGLLISGISSCLTSLNFWTTILNLRSYYLTLKTIPLFPWAFLITAFMLLLTLPILSGTLLLILGDLHSSTLFNIYFGFLDIFKNIPGLHSCRRPTTETLKPQTLQTLKRPNLANPQTLKPSNPQTLKPSNPQTLKPSNPQTLQTLSPGFFAEFESGEAP